MKIDIRPAPGSLCGEHYIDVDRWRIGKVSGEHQTIQLYVGVPHHLMSAVAEAVREKQVALQEAYSRAKKSGFTIIQGEEDHVG